MELAEKLRVAAEAGNRSMNAEIVARLEQSFGGVAPEMGGIARDLVEEFAAKRKISFVDALDALIVAGSSPGAPSILYVKAQQGMTLKEVREVMSEARKIADDESSVVYEMQKRTA